MFHPKCRCHEIRDMSLKVWNQKSNHQVPVPWFTLF